VSELSTSQPDAPPLSGWRKVLSSTLNVLSLLVFLLFFLSHALMILFHGYWVALYEIGLGDSVRVGSGPELFYLRAFLAGVLILLVSVSLFFFRLFSSTNLKAFLDKNRIRMGIYLIWLGLLPIANWGYFYVLGMAHFAPEKLVLPHDVRVTEITNSIGMKLNGIPPGTFLMGDPSSPEGQHQVTISKPFYMGTTPVTQGQYVAVMGYDETVVIPGKQRDEFPVQNVSWLMAVAFCEKLSKMEGRTYRLPREAEWEYACRAGSTTRYYWGDYKTHVFMRGWRKFPPHPLELTMLNIPNAFGLYDFGKYALEWCSDWYGPYDAKAVIDPTGLEKGDCRVLRGNGSCSSSREGWHPEARDYGTGFRVVLEMIETPKDLNAPSEEKCDRSSP